MARKPRILSARLALLLLLLAVSSAKPTPRSSSSPDWEPLNRTVNGRLRAATPFALPCFSSYQGQASQPSADLCAAVQRNYASALFRTDTFGGYMHSQGEICAGPPTSQCILGNTDPSSDPLAFSKTSCGQGNLPSYYIEIQEPRDVQAAFEFSKRTGVKLSVKNSGRDYLSRSSLKGFLALWTRELQQLSHDVSFAPDGCDSKAVFNAITMGAGVNLDQVYRYADEQKCHLHWGSKLRTPDGRFLIANDCTNRDLFWALRGGGGGAFGVVLESTYRVEPITDTSTGVRVHYLSGNLHQHTPVYIAHRQQFAHLGRPGVGRAPRPKFHRNGQLDARTDGRYSINGLRCRLRPFPKRQLQLSSPPNHLTPADIMRSASGRSEVTAYLNKALLQGSSPVIFQTTPYLYLYEPGTTPATPDSQQRGIGMEQHTRREEEGGVEAERSDPRPRGISARQRRIWE
ncbi:hypothetical protein GP486_006301 [Trichoglossum hirsutum]|uniref:FAD linked oxidase N-terminal domain-containing protein n=1 Tax=Trichoglossum hirsutum TaxID=265104 RepID=A0A9P8I8D0_9PEZI|nr:hypothetical protein GP486_006301 [Trichoglossum hirsutum]